MNCVLAIYEIRGIQKYIFKTNKLKEIIGASLIVKNLMINELKTASKNYNAKLDGNGAFLFDNDESIDFEVLYDGGGNLLVAYRSEEICKEVSKQMAINILKKAYGLSLIYTYIDKTNNYSQDYKNVTKKLSEIKSVTALSRYNGILPIVEYDNLTGYPLSKRDKNGRMITLESYQKLKQSESLDNDKYCYKIDDMRTNNEEGLIAVVHIDGNNMGMSIRNILKDVNDYSDAVNRMRTISNNIKIAFESKALKNIENNMQKICEKHNIHIEEKYPYRPIIQAGDDITFISNERISLDIVEEFIRSINKEKIYVGENNFSACAGIAIVHAHYPFYKAYELAEKCCESAKKRAKNEGKVNNATGNFVDIQVCASGFIKDLDEFRTNNYSNIEGKYLLKRPFGIYDENDNLTEEQRTFSLDSFKNNLKYLNKIVNRSNLKLMRDTYYETEHEINYVINRINKMKQLELKTAGYKCATYYDELELFDYFKEV